jgi:hypothetical protein
MLSSEKSIAIFLGAGASAALGYRVTSQLLPEILARLSAGQLFAQESSSSNDANAAENRAILGEQLRCLLPGLDSVDAKSLPLITEIISLVDYSLAQGRALWPRQPRDALIHLRRLLEWALLDVLRSPITLSGQAHEELLTRFGDWLLSQRDRGLTVLSTNYDIAVEQYLYNKLRHALRANRRGVAEEIDFGLSWLDPGEDRTRVEHQRPAAPALRVLKLHGSLNWLYCACCEGIYINEYGAIADNAYRGEIDDDNSCHCGHGKLQMHIVAPSLFREVSDANLLQVWRAALAALCEAEDWMIVGYSFPAEDIAIRSLFTRAFNIAQHLRKRPPRVEVVQRSDEAKSRYLAFFGQHCNYRTGGLEAKFPPTYR